MMTADPAQSPKSTVWPRVGVSCAVFRANSVLLIERGSGALKGRWSLPGGHIEPGEMAREAAVREVREETCVEACLLDVAHVHEVIQRDAAGLLAAHYVLIVFCATWVAGEPQARSDAAAARFIPLSEVEGYSITDGLLEAIERARRAVKGAVQPA